MDTKIKKVILKYFKNCIEEDSKESLKIDLNNSKSIIYFPKEDENFDEYLNFAYDENEKNIFYQILWINQENYDNNFLIWFFIKTRNNFNNSKYSIQKWWKYELNWYIKYETNWLRIQLINKLNYYKKILKLNLPLLEKENLKELFFSPDKWKNWISKIDFKPNLDFLDFYDNNKNENFYLVLEYIEIQDKDEKFNLKDNIITPLYLIWIEITSNDDWSFELSLKESEPEFLYNIKNKKWINIFPFSTENNWDDWFQEIQNLENDIKWITSSFSEKINYYKSKISQNINKEDEFIFNPCIITWNNNIQIIKNLLFDYNWIIQNKTALENLENNSLWFIFNENKFSNSWNTNQIINISSLNQEQEKIVNNVLNQNISVVIWPPWTWKSQVVVNLLANMYINNKTVIFASKNNTAVNTVIEKLEKYDFPYFPFLRLGNKQATNEWLPKILWKISKDTWWVHKEYSFNDIQNQKDIIKKIYNEIENIQKEYLDYYQEYEKFELLLWEISDEKVKDFLYKLLPLKLSFEKLKNDNIKNNNFLQSIEILKKDIIENKNIFEKLKNQILEIWWNEIKDKFDQIIQKNIKNYKSDYIKNTDDFNKLVYDIEEKLLEYQDNIKKHKDDINLLSQSSSNFIFDYDFLDYLLDKDIDYVNLIDIFDWINNWIIKSKNKINKNDIYVYFLKNWINNSLEKILEKWNFIDYNNNLTIELKKLTRDFKEINEYGWFKKIFWIQKKDFKKIYNSYLDLINLQSNIEIKNYFINVNQKNSTDSEDILYKIDDIFKLHDYEKTYNNFVNWNNDLQNNLKLQEEYIDNLKSIFWKYFKNWNFLEIWNEIDNISKSLKLYKKILKIEDNIRIINQEKEYSIKEYNNYLSKISDELYINFFNLNYEIILNLFDLLLESKNKNIFIQNLVQEEQKNLNDYKSFQENIFTELQKNIWWDFLIYLKEKFSWNIWSIFNEIIKLEDTNKVKNNINNFLNKLKTNKKSISILSKELSGEQKVLEEKSKNYFSYKIYGNTKDFKPQIKDSIEWIYHAYDKSKETWKNKDVFLKEMYEKVFWKVNIFVTTNQSTYNLPLEKGFYDYLIIDEASQNDLASIIPLMYRCKKIIVIWDPHQLQNITKLTEENSKKIFEQKLNEINIDPKIYEIDFKNIFNYGKSKDYSLSAFNSINHIYNWVFNQETLALKEHYRCYSDIINFSNKIIWEYDLFPKSYIFNKIIDEKITPLWIHWLKSIKAKDTEKTKQNDQEAKAIIEYLKELIQFYWDKITIWVISPYRNQVTLLNTYLRQEWLSEQKNILINTVHRFQWDEKDIILYSPVYPKSNLWNDKNLLNVAVSRAKSAFYIFWDKDSIYKAKDENWINLMKELIDYIDIISKQKEIIKINKFDTEYEKIFFEELKKANIKFDFHSIENNWKYELDFKLKLKWFNKYLNIELDWNSHDNKKSYDYTRNKIVEKLWNIEVIRYTNRYLMENIWEIIESLKKVCEVENNIILDDSKNQTQSVNIEKKKFNYKDFVNNKYWKPVIQYQNEKIEIIKKAVDLNKNIKFTYKNQKWEISKREIKIIDFWEYEFEWLKYLWVKWFCKLRNEERVFNIKNMRYIEII